MARKYSKSASSDVERVMKKRKAGTLKSGGSGKTVRSRKQAIAIGLSEARAEGKKVPKKSAAGAKKTTVKKSTAKKAVAKKAAPRKTTARKTTARKTTTRKTVARKTGRGTSTARKAGTTAVRKTAKKTAKRAASRVKSARKTSTARKTTKKSTKSRS